MKATFNSKKFRLSQNAENLRKFYGYTQLDISKKLNISRNIYQNAVSKRTMLKPKYMYKLAEILKTEIKDLVEERKKVNEE